MELQLIELIREVSSRYMSASTNAPSVPKRYPSPVPRSTGTSASTVVPKRAESAERKRPSTPTSLSYPSTPFRDIELSLGARKIALTKQPENVWPSTMRSLCASFQSDGVLATKKEKQPDSPRTFRKETSEIRSPLIGKSLIDQAENAKPDDSSLARFVDQHQWPSRIGGKVSSSSLLRSVDFTDKIIRYSFAKLRRVGIPSSRRVSDGMSKPIHRTSSDASTQIPLERKGLEGDLSLDIHLFKLN